MPFICDPYNARAVKIQDRLTQIMGPESLDSRLHVVLGGDGFMLKTLREYHTPEAIFLGLNCGRVGFLLNDLPQDLTTLPDLLTSPDLQVTAYPRIKMEAEDLDGRTHRDTALNDIYLERMTGQTANLRIDINGSEVVGELVADGLIVASALGSTAYGYSAGGPVCHPDLPALSITPICAHIPRLSPMVFPLNCTISVQVLKYDRRPVRAVADGFEYAHIRHIQVSSAESPVNLAFFAGHDFTAALVRKLLRGGPTPHHHR